MDPALFCYNLGLTRLEDFLQQAAGPISLVGLLAILSTSPPFPYKASIFVERRLALSVSTMGADGAFRVVDFHKGNHKKLGEMQPSCLC